MQEIRQMWVCAGVGCRLDRRTVFLGWKIFFVDSPFDWKRFVTRWNGSRFTALRRRRTRYSTDSLGPCFSLTCSDTRKFCFPLSYIIIEYFGNVNFQECLSFCCRLQFFQQFILLMKPDIWQRVTSKSSETISFQHRLVTDESLSSSSISAETTVQNAWFRRKRCHDSTIEESWISDKALSKLRGITAPFSRSKPPSVSSDYL